MTHRLTSLVWLSVLGLTVPAQAAVTVTITNPGNNAAVTCNVNIRADVLYGQDRNPAGYPKVRIRNSSGTIVVNDASMSPVDAETYEYNWWTPNQSNDGTSHPFTIEVRADHTDAQMQDPQTTVSNLVNVNARNGWRYKSASATVVSPTANQGFTVSQTFRLETNHQVVWERFDDCQDIIVAYKFLQHTNQSGQEHYREIGNTALLLNTTVGDHPVTLNNWWQTWTTQGPAGNYTAYAASETPVGTVRASDAKNFSIAP